MSQIGSRPALHVGVTHDYRSPVRAELSGGDVVALNRHDDGSTAVLIADLSSKGAEGAAYGSWLTALFQVTSAFVSRPSAILAHLNRMLVHAFAYHDEGLFATAFVFRVLPAHSLLIYSSAGAEPPLFVRNATLHATLKTGNHVLGIEHDAVYCDRAMPLSRNDLLVAFTDGITESRRRANAAHLGADGVAEAVRESFFRSASPSSEDVFSAIDGINGGVYYDDATLLVAAVHAA